jgi:hypothetical protein
VKSLLAGARGMLPERVSARNSDMILALIVGLRRAFMKVPFIEQDMVVEGE